LPPSSVAAALFSGISLYLSGKREERRWRRDALLNTYQRFIELSFERSFKTVLGIRVRRGIEPDDPDELRKEESELHLEYDSLLTRIRLLGNGDVVAASERLHASDQELVQLSLRSDAPATASDCDTFEKERQRNRQAKEALLKAARETLGFEPTAPIDDLFWGTSATE
jgi:hypothetical protein